MKIARIFAYLFGALGTALMVFSVGLCLVSLDREPKVMELPDGAEACSQAVMDAFQAGDLHALSALLDGQPDFGENQKPEGNYGMVWDTYRNSVRYEFLGGCYASGEYLCRDVAITYLDVSSVMDSLPQRAHVMLTARVETAVDMAELYDEQGEFREDLVAKVLQDALVRCLAEDGKLVTKEVTLTLLQQDGTWLAVPGAGFYTALTGGLQ